MNFVYKENCKNQLPVLREADLDFGDFGKKHFGKEHFPYLAFPSLEEVKVGEKSFVKHLFTTRHGGVSEGIFSSLNLSFTRGDDAEAVAENYRRVAMALGTTPDKIVCSDQTHTTNVRLVTDSDCGRGVTREKGYTDVDGLITNTPGVVLATFYADCVPLFFVDPAHRAIGLSHSGWRGTVGRMGAATLAAMNREFGTNPEDVYAAIGPSICQDCYEVSLDVAERFLAEFGDSVAKEKEPVDGERKFLLDLWKANEIVMLEAGILPEHLATTSLCTCCNDAMLFSHRASKGQRGNLGAFMMINE